MATGRKTGGRQKGTPNRASIERQQAVAASGLVPLEFMLQVLRDEKQELSVRLEAARAAAPYVHPRLSSVDVRNKGDRPFVIQIKRFSDVEGDK